MGYKSVQAPLTDVWKYAILSLLIRGAAGVFLRLRGEIFTKIHKENPS